MDPISGLSLAASVIALIQISREAAQICTDLIETGCVSQYRVADDAATDIEKSLVALRVSLKAASGSASNQDDELLYLAGKCSSTANNLKLTLNKLKKDPNGGFRDALKKTLRAMTKKKEIEQNRRDLDDYEKALNTRILVRLNTSVAKASEGYDEVRRQLTDLGISIESSSQATAQKVTEQLQNSAQGINFLEDLRFPDIFSRQEQISDVHKKTFEWIFSASKSSGPEGKWANFTAWLEETEGPNLIYWIHGKPGAGKSTLMTYVIEDPRTHDSLRAWCGQAELLTPSFFFWAAGSSLQKQVQGLLRSIMYQILADNEKILSELLTTSRNKRGLRLRSGLAWTERRLLGFLDEIIKIAASMGICICFFLDGLDEYDGDIDLLKTWIFDLNTHRHVKVCVSSRPEEAFRRAFTGMPQLRLQDLTRGDIELYIHDRLESRIPDSLEIYRSAASAPNKFTKQQLVEKMLRSADGVFLWVKLVVRDLLIGLEAGESLEQLHTRLEETPLEIRGLYAHMLKKVPRSLEPRTISYLSLMLATHIWGDNNVDSEGASGLKLLELACSQDDLWKMVSNSDLSFGSESSFDQICNRLESQIVFCCAGLLDIEDLVEKEMPQKHFRALNFIHRSAIEFLQNDSQWAPKTALAPAFIQLARAKTGLWSLVASDILEVHFIDPRNVDILLDEKDPLLRQIRKTSSQNRVKFVMINSALTMEDFIGGQDSLKELDAKYEEVIDSLCKLLKRFSAKLWEDQVQVTRWQPKGIDSVIGKDAESNIPYLATLGFQRTINYIEHSSVTTASDFDRLVDYVLCSFSCGSKIILKNLVAIAHTAFERGAALERSLTVQFHFFRTYDWLKDENEGLPCSQSTWSFLIWRFIHSNSVFNDPISAEHIECVGPFLEFCLSKVTKSNATCLIPIREHEELGYFIHEFSLSALVRLRVHEPHKTRFLQILEKHDVDSSDQISYFVDTDLALYRLTEAQSDMIADLVRERDGVQDFYEFNWGASHGDKIDETRQLAGKRLRETLKDATFLGSLKNGVVVGDQTTYEPSTENEALLNKHLGVGQVPQGS